MKAWVRNTLLTLSFTGVGIGAINTYESVKKLDEVGSNPIYADHKVLLSNLDYVNRAIEDENKRFKIKPGIMYWHSQLVDDIRDYEEHHKSELNNLIEDESDIRITGAENALFGISMGLLCVYLIRRKR